MPTLLLLEAEGGEEREGVGEEAEEAEEGEGVSRATTVSKTDRSVVRMEDTAIRLGG